MPSPVEFRHYMRRLTLADVAAGIQPIRQQLPNERGELTVKLFAPPTLQWRYREKIHVDGVARLEWSEWQDVGYVRAEGDDAAEAPKP